MIVRFRWRSSVVSPLMSPGEFRMLSAEGFHLEAPMAFTAHSTHAFMSLVPTTT